MACKRKLVKGDVIASLIITAVNLLGGVAIGVLQRGMTVEGALKRFGLLSIGDGLVSQIPALVLSTGAGLLVTRVASEEPDTPLGGELGAQLFGTPRALLVASGFVGLLAIVPGLPTLPFLIIAVLLFVVSRSRLQKLEVERVDRSTAATPANTRPTAARKAPSFVPVVAPWAIELSSDLEPLVDDLMRGPDVERPGIGGALYQLRERLFDELGVPLPAPRLRLVDGMPQRHVALLLFEVPAHVVALPDELPEAETAAVVAGEVYGVLRARAADFLGLNETQLLLDQLEQVSPAVVRQVVPKPVSLTLLADVLRRLVEEQVSIRDLRAVLEALAAHAPSERDPLSLTELVRSQLRRATTYRLTGGASHLDIALVDPLIEDTIRGAITRNAAGSFLTLAPAAARDILASFRTAMRELPDDAPPIVVLTAPDIRRFVRKLIETDFPELPVVSFAELLPEVQLRPAVRVSPRD